MTSWTTSSMTYIPPFYKIKRHHWCIKNVSTGKLQNHRTSCPTKKIRNRKVPLNHQRGIWRLKVSQALLDHRITQYAFNMLLYSICFYWFFFWIFDSGDILHSLLYAILPGLLTPHSLPSFTSSEYPSGYWCQVQDSIPKTSCPHTCSCSRLCLRVRRRWGQTRGTL